MAICLGHRVIHSLFLEGADATEAFYGLHRHEVLEKPQYRRLIIGLIRDETSALHSRVVGELSRVPYAEPTWLSEGYYSPYHNEVGIHPLLNYIY